MDFLNDSDICHVEDMPEVLGGSSSSLDLNLQLSQLGAGADTAGSVEEQLALGGNTNIHSSSPWTAMLASGTVKQNSIDDTVNNLGGYLNPYPNGTMRSVPTPSSVLQHQQTAAPCLPVASPQPCSMSMQPTEFTYSSYGYHAYPAALFAVGSPYYAASTAPSSTDISGLQCYRGSQGVWPMPQCAPAMHTMPAILTQAPPPRTSAVHIVKTPTGELTKTRCLHSVCDVGRKDPSQSHDMGKGPLCHGDRVQQVTPMNDGNKASSVSLNSTFLEEEEHVPNRQASLARYKEKKSKRNFTKKVRYQMRKQNADKRPRIKGRFIKSSEMTEYAEMLNNAAASPILE